MRASGVHWRLGTNDVKFWYFFRFRPLDLNPSNEQIFELDCSFANAEIGEQKNEVKHPITDIDRTYRTIQVMRIGKSKNESTKWAIHPQIPIVRTGSNKRFFQKEKLLKIIIIAHHYLVDDKGKRGETRQEAETICCLSTVSLFKVFLWTAYRYVATILARGGRHSLPL